MAEAIVIAEVDKFLPNEELGVRFRTIETIKGQPNRTFLGWGYENEAVRSDPVNLSRAHPNAYRGPCIRESFQKGRLYVMFLGINEHFGEMIPLGFPFARVNEDVTDTDAFWIRVIKLYLEIQKDRAPMAQIERLRELAQEIRAQEQTAENSALLLDIETHLVTMSPRKPTRYLLETYRALERTGGPYPNVVGSWGHEEGSSKEEIAAMVRREAEDVTEEEAELFKRTILWSLSEGPHPDAEDLFEGLLVRGDVNHLPMAMKYLVNHGQLERARQVALEKTHIVLSLEQGPVIERFVYALLFVEMPLDYRVALYWSLRERGFSNEFRLRPGESEGIPPWDYRSNERLTIAMATVYYQPVINWAFEQLEEQNEPAMERLPVRVILNTSTDEARERLYDLFCEGGLRREYLIQGLADLGRYDTDDWIVRIGQFDGLTARENELFGKMLAARTHRVEIARELDISGTLVKYSRDYDYLLLFLRGEKLQPPEWQKDFVPVNCN